MNRLPLPQVDLEAHFRRCAAATRDHALRVRLQNSENVVKEAARTYDVAGLVSAFYAFASDDAAPATDEELGDLYGRTMVPKKSAGQSVYAQILHGATQGLCPLCGQRTARSLDHYLPKEAHPKLSIVPLNLVPSCLDCNHRKHTYVPSNQNNQLLHPYYDDVSDATWLRGQVVYDGNAPVVTFDAVPPATWPTTKQERLRNHFEKFALSELYGIYGTAEIRIVRHGVLRILNNGGGPNDVRDHLQLAWNDRSAVNPNSWQSATYGALVTSDRICAGELGD